MPQTLLSLAGLLVVTLVSFNQQQSALRAKKQAVRAQVRQMAVGVAKENMELMRNRAFDAKAIDDSPPVSGLTATSNFPTGQNCQVFGGPTPCPALEDFHQMDPAIVEVPTPLGTARFQVRIQVHYVETNASGDISRTTSRTTQKEVTIRVRDVPETGNPRMAEPIVVKEVHGYL